LPSYIYFVLYLEKDGRRRIDGGNYLLVADVFSFMSPRRLDRDEFLEFRILA